MEGKSFKGIEMKLILIALPVLGCAATASGASP